jgi:hypothetical protein
LPAPSSVALPATPPSPLWRRDLSAPSAPTISPAALQTKLPTSSQKLKTNIAGKHTTPKFTDANGKTVRCCTHFCDAKRNGWLSRQTCDGMHYDKDCPLGGPRPHNIGLTELLASPATAPESPREASSAAILEALLAALSPNSPGDNVQRHYKCVVERHPPAYRH